MIKNSVIFVIFCLFVTDLLGSFKPKYIPTEGQRKILEQEENENKKIEAAFVQLQNNISSQRPFLPGAGIAVAELLLDFKIKNYVWLLQTSYYRDIFNGLVDSMQRLAIEKGWEDVEKSLRITYIPVFINMKRAFADLQQRVELMKYMQQEVSLSEFEELVKDVGDFLDDNSEKLKESPVWACMYRSFSDTLEEIANRYAWNKSLVILKQLEKEKLKQQILLKDLYRLKPLRMHRPEPIKSDAELLIEKKLKDEREASLFLQSRASQQPIVATPMPQQDASVLDWEIDFGPSREAVTATEPGQNPSNVTPYPGSGRLSKTQSIASAKRMAKNSTPSSTNSESSLFQVD